LTRFPKAPATGTLYLIKELLSEAPPIKVTRSRI